MLCGGIRCDVGENGGNRDYLIIIDNNATINQLCAPLEVGHVSTPRPKTRVL